MVVRLNFLDESAPGKILPNSAFGRDMRFFILLLLAGFIILLYESFLLYSLGKEERSLSEQLHRLVAEQDNLGASFARMTDRLENETEKLRFIMGSLGATEILSVLACLRTEGVTMDELRFFDKELVLEGRCESPQQARAFAAALSVSGLFSSIGEPVIAGSEGDEVLSLIFTFTGRMLPSCSLAAPQKQD